MLPDVMSNVGGVVGSYFEWVQNRTGYYWTEDEYNEQLKIKMRQGYEDVLALKENIKSLIVLPRICLRSSVW